MSLALRLATIFCGAPGVMVKFSLALMYVLFAGCSWRIETASPRTRGKKKRPSSRGGELQKLFFWAPAVRCAGRFSLFLVLLVRNTRANPTTPPVLHDITALSVRALRFITLIMLSDFFHVWCSGVLVFWYVLKRELFRQKVATCPPSTSQAGGDSTSLRV